MEEYIKNIVELDIDLDNITLEDMGVDTVSFVTDPAIEIDFMAFASQEFVKPHAGESEDEFIGRCIPVLIGEGKEQDEAVAICYSYWEGKEEFESYNDYPEAAKANAQRALDWAEENNYSIGYNTSAEDMRKKFAYGEETRGEGIS